MILFQELTFRMLCANCYFKKKLGNGAGDNVEALAGMNKGKVL